MLRLHNFVVVLCLVASLAWSADKTVSDDTIYDQVRIKLAADREVGAAGIDVKVKDGVVELQGNVKKESVRGKAEKIAKHVRGVKSVVNQLQISSTGGPPVPAPGH